MRVARSELDSVWLHPSRSIFLQPLTTRRSIYKFPTGFLQSAEMMSRRLVGIVRSPRTAPASGRFSTTTRLLQKYESSVETPVQSQNKDTIAPSAVRPEGEASVLETPVQRQRREALAPRAGATSREKSRALLWLILGVLAVPPISYYYYQHRKEHMDAKRAGLMEEQRRKYAQGG